MRLNRWSEPPLDRRIYPRAEYRRTAPALLELEGYRCAVRDLAPGGLRVEPAPAGRVWEVGERVSGILHLRTMGRVFIDAVIGRMDAGGSTVIAAHALQSRLERDVDGGDHGDALVYHNRTWHRLGDHSRIA